MTFISLTDPNLSRPDFSYAADACDDLVMILGKEYLDNYVYEGGEGEGDDTNDNGFEVLDAIEIFKNKNKNNAIKEEVEGKLLENREGAAVAENNALPPLLGE